APEAANLPRCAPDHSGTPDAPEVPNLPRFVPDVSGSPIVSGAANAAAEPGVPAAFTPPRWLCNPHLQTIVANRRWRLLARPEARRLRGLEWVIDAGDGVRLQGFHTVAAGGIKADGKKRAAATGGVSGARGMFPVVEVHGKTSVSGASIGSPPSRRALVVMIHGWEGSAESVYMRATASHLHQRGHDVFRLNLRDHGDSHHLNPGLFSGAHIGEVVGAVRRLQRLAGDRPMVLLGFSLGGNFALRVGIRAAAAGIDRLVRIYAVSPCLDPAATTLAIDRSFIYRRYFLPRWRRSLRRKAELFPDRYDLARLGGADSCMALTDAVIAAWSPFASAADYFASYTLTGNALGALTVPATIVAAADDPVIPAADYDTLPSSPLLEVHLQPAGGHCGFLERLPAPAWYERFIADHLESTLAELPFVAECAS
ncbi:MAG: alpha/beta fold hydrolase, partial [Deltaproteobacteria bacterium]|nr:alpha/beta fold hydrolase [Candidatus Anaeroferrophillacea bacterium]